MKFSALPLVVALLCFNTGYAMDRDLDRTFELGGGVLTGACTAVLASLTVVSAYGTGLVAKDTYKAVVEQKSVPEVCGRLALTSLLGSVSAFLAGMTWEAGAYSASMLGSTERPSISLLGFAGSICKAVADNTGKHHTHHHYYHKQ